ncbi:AAA family ATPase [Streptomyces dioscori]|uniref:AAA family ATPase n=1 Tax=Streptomyces dioscori TaxID=2109333 RepID=UPI0021F15D32|nr:AAA family ATPase [Streptomyces dioscori]
MGRDGDLERISRLLDAPDSNGALLVSGEAGVGKSAVLDVVAETAAAAGSFVLRAGGVQFEADISYSTLNQALLPLRDGMVHLDGTHRAAVRVALGLSGGRPPERAVLFDAIMVLLRQTAEDSPVLIVVDDLPWVDRASAAALTFVARQLSSTGVGFLGSFRTGTVGFFENDGLPVHVLPPLDRASAAHLSKARFPGLAGQVRRRLLDAAQGNPLALLELPKELGADQSASLGVLPPVLALSDRLQSLYTSRVHNLPATTQQLLLLAALEGSGDLDVLAVAACEMLGRDALETLTSAEHDQLVQLNRDSRRLTFRHPLIRSAVFESSTSTRRRAAHLALAHALSDKPETRAWHLGEATLKPEESVAALLEDAAHRILGRGDAVAAVAALTRAADLSPRGPDRARRLTEAAYLGAEATGTLHNVHDLLEEAQRADADGGRSLHAAAAAVQLLLNSDGDITTAHHLLVGAIRQGTHGYDAHDAALTDALHLLLLVCFFAGREELWPAFHETLALLRPEPPALLSIASETFADPARTREMTLLMLDRILDEAGTEDDPAWLIRMGTVSIFTDRLALLRDTSWRLVGEGRDGGPVRRHLGGLMHLCLDDYVTGRWDEVVQLADEGLEACSRSGYTFDTWYYWYCKGLVVASRGDARTAGELADLMTGWAAPRGLRATLRCADHVRAVACAASGDFAQALRHTEAISPAGRLAPYVPQALWVFFDLVESAVRANRRADAVAHVDALRQAGVRGISSRLALLVGGATALVREDDEEAAQLFRATLAEQDARLWPFDMARVQLAYGERLRRARAAVESKGPLMEALRTFQRLGALPWAERASNELRAAGHAMHGEDHGGGALTPQEREIAKLAAGGLTNKQIAERLYISHRTVGAHLYQIYPKLGITSRVALQDALAALENTERNP